MVSMIDASISFIAVFSDNNGGFNNKYALVDTPISLAITEALIKSVKMNPLLIHSSLITSLLVSSPIAISSFTLYFSSIPRALERVSLLINSGRVSATIFFIVPVLAIRSSIRFLVERDISLLSKKLPDVKILKRFV